MAASSSQRLSPCCRNSAVSAEDGDPAAKKGCSKSSHFSPCHQKTSSSKLKIVSPCCSKTPMFTKNSTPILSPNHYKMASNKGTSLCCSGPKEEVEYLHFSGDQLDDVFANPPLKKTSSRCSSGVQSPTTPCKLRHSSARQTPKTRILYHSSGYSSGKPSPKLSNQSIFPSREETSQKPCCKSSKSFPRPHLQGSHSPSCQTNQKISVYFSPGDSLKPSPFQARSLETPFQCQLHSSLHKRKDSVSISHPGGTPKPTDFLSSSRSSSLKSAPNGQQLSKTGSSCDSANQSYSILPLKSALELPKQHISQLREENSCKKPVCRSPPSSQSHKRVQQNRPVSWPPEVPTASPCTKLLGVSPGDSPRDGRPPSKQSSRSSSPFCGSIFGTPPIQSNSADSWILTTSPDLHKSASINIWSPSLILNAFGSTLSQSSCKSSASSSQGSSQGSSPSRSTISCFPFARSPKRSRRSQTTIEPAEVLNGSTSMSLPFSRSCPKHCQKGSGSQSVRIYYPTMQPAYDGLNSRSQNDPLALPNYHQPTNLIYSGAQTRPGRGLLEIPDLTMSRPLDLTTFLQEREPTKVLYGSTSMSSPFPRSCPKHGQKDSRSQSGPMLPYYGRLTSRPQNDPIALTHYHESASLSFSGAQIPQRTGVLGIPDLEVSSPLDLKPLLQETDPPSGLDCIWSEEPSCTETKCTPLCEAQQAGPGRARKFWAHLRNKFTSLSSGCCRQDLKSLLNLILCPSKGPANPQDTKDEWWIEYNDTRAFFIFGVNVVIVILLSYFVDLLHDGKQNGETVKAADDSRHPMCCHPFHHHHPPSHCQGYPVYNADIIK